MSNVDEERNVVVALTTREEVSPAPETCGSNVITMEIVQALLTEQAAKHVVERERERLAHVEELQKTNTTLDEFTRRGRANRRGEPWLY